jgi:hypothetical protein
MTRRATKLWMLFCVAPIFQLTGCAVLDGGFIEQALIRALTDTLTESAFETFYSMANPQ